ncbi:MAG: sodium:solute symporter family protein [Deltaproteobacteria bacterium]|nr:sodium:solute symporter family protein [Deltaproteobacteria bacterium]
MTVTGAVILVFIVYVIIIAIIGYIGWKKTQLTPEDYFLAGRTLGAFVLSLTLIATYASMWTFLGAVGANYRLGTSFMACMITWNLLWPLMIWVFGVRIWLLGKKFGYITPSDMFADYYKSETMRVIASVIGIIALIPYMSIQLLGGGLAFEAATGGAIPFWAGALIMVIVIALYTFFGGLRAVAWTDVLQGLFFLVVLLILSIWAIKLTGGNPFRIIAERHPEIFDPGRFKWALWFGFIMTWGFAPLLPHMIQRAFMAKSGKAITQSAVSIAILSPWFQTVTVMLIGISALVLLPGLKGAATDAIIPALLAKYAPYVGAVIISAAFAAGMSTLDSQLISASSLLTRDIWVKYIDPKADPKRETLVGKIFVLVVTVFMFFFVLTKPGFIVVLGTAGAGICIAAYIFPLIGVLFWPRVGKTAALWSLIVAGVVAFVTFAIWKFPFGVHNTLWGMLAGLIAFLILTYATKPVSYEEQKKFHGYLTSAIHGGKTK